MSRPATRTRPPVATSSRSKQLEERRLARARRADEEDELALGDLEGDVAEGDDIALVDLGDVFEANHGESEGTAGPQIGYQRSDRPSDRVE